MLVVVIGIRFVSWIKPTERSLLPTASEITKIEDLETLPALVTLPSEILSATLYEASVYTLSKDGFPQGTVKTVYTKDDWRFVEIDYLPNITAQEYLATHIYPTQEVSMNETTRVWIQTIDTKPRCITYDDGVPNQCEISRYIIVETIKHLVLIASDGDHATEGELLQIARSIIAGDSIASSGSAQ